MKIGIDLGTTNSALAYIDEREAEDRDFPPLRIFETPQLVAPDRVEPRHRDRGISRSGALHRRVGRLSRARWSIDVE